MSLLGPVVRLLRSNPEFRRLFAAHSISRAGHSFNTIGLLVLVFNLTGSGLGVAATVAFEVLPILLLAPLFGLVVDRHPRRTIMVLADVARAGLALVLAVFGDSVTLAYAVAFGLSAFTQLFNPAASSILPQIVEADDLVDANMALWTVAVVAQIVLAPLAGMLIAFYSTDLAFLVNAASYIVSALLLCGLRAGRNPAAASSASGWQAVFQGVREVRSDPLLVHLAGAQTLAALSAGATGGLLVVLAAERLSVGPAGFGLLLGAIGLGAGLGPVLLSRFIRAEDRRWLFGPYALRGAIDFVLATTSSAVIAAPALIAYGVGTSTGMIAYQSTLQRRVPAEIRGRVFSFYDVIWNAARLVSLGAGGLLADAFGIQAVYLLGGALLFIAFAVGWTAPTQARTA